MDGWMAGGLGVPGSQFVGTGSCGLLFLPPLCVCPVPVIWARSAASAAPDKKGNQRQP